MKRQASISRPQVLYLIFHCFSLHRFLKEYTVKVVRKPQKTSRKKVCQDQKHSRDQNQIRRLLAPQTNHSSFDILPTLPRPSPARERRHCKCHPPCAIRFAYALKPTHKVHLLSCQDRYWDCHLLPWTLSVQ